MAYEIRDNLTNVNYTPSQYKPIWIVVHNTANGTSQAGTAYNNTQYFKNVDRNASANYFIDDGDIIWRCVEDYDTAWHCGDASSQNGCYNYNSIGIEVCEREDGSFSEHEIDVLTWLVGMLMDKYGIPPERVCRHYDVTGKHCPMGYIDDWRWSELHARITGGEDMAAEDVINYPISGPRNTLTLGQRIVDIESYLYDETDPTGRDKEANMKTRIAWMAEKQEKQQAQLDRIEKMLKSLIPEKSEGDHE